MIPSAVNYNDPQEPARPREALTVSLITQQIKMLLEETLPPFWVTGEISNFKRHTSGHFYFSLKDEGAQIPCVMWAGRNRSLYFTPKDGMQVLVHGQVTVYEKRGYYQLDVWQMQPAGLGALQQAFEQLKQRLQAEGLFDATHKIPLPRFPQRVGLVTSPTGAAIRDLVSVLRRRWPSMQIVLRPVRVQGSGAAAEIAAAIAEFNEYGKVDLLIVGRGGGSLEDLWPFNEEVVARAIYNSKLPVVSAVGHEIDFSISDFVADVRAATPSVAAEMVAPEAREIRNLLLVQLRRGFMHLKRKAQLYRERLHRIASSYGLRQPLNVAHQRTQELDELFRRMSQALRQRQERSLLELENLSKRLNALSHASILRRGFALVYRKADGVLVRHAQQVHEADLIRVQMATSAIEAEVITPP
ncbi:exodeoxyribonuclease VII large subunit [candidate division KSB1 bacterium]|nr:exodeoxyribonuclease VII large subunit [candidate division KSB1 bacterium]